MYDALVMALRDYMSKTGFTRAVVAVSGGIDSALALAIAVDALGPDHVSAFNMPSQFNTETTRSIAAQRGGRARRALRDHPDSGPRRPHPAGVRSARAPDCARLHAREPAGAHPRPPDDGRVERHGRAPHLVRQRNRDRARLRDALRRHVRRHLAHRRPVEDRRLPAGAARQRAARRGEDPRGHVPASSRPPSSPPTSSTRSTTPSSRRSSARWSSGA